MTMLPQMRRNLLRSPVSIPQYFGEELLRPTELTFFYPITVALVARFNQVFDNREPLADHALTFRQLRRLGPSRDFWREFRDRTHCRDNRDERQATDSGNSARRD